MSFGLGTHTVTMTPDSVYGTLTVPAGTYEISASSSDGGTLTIQLDDPYGGEPIEYESGDTVDADIVPTMTFNIEDASQNMYTVEVNVEGFWIAEENDNFASAPVYDIGKTEAAMTGTVKACSGRTMGEAVAVEISQTSEDGGEVYICDEDGTDITEVAVGDEVNIYGKTAGTVVVTMTDGETASKKILFVQASTEITVGGTFELPGATDLVSSDTTVATVSGNVVTGVGAGYAKVTYADEASGDIASSWFHVVE